MLITLPDGWEEVSQQVRRPQASGKRRDWYKIEDKTEAPAEVYIYDEIGAWGTTAKQFTTDLQAVKAKIINVHINTPGGDVFDGIAIHNALRMHPATVNVTVDSLAASIGSVIAMAGDTIAMAPYSTMMIHDPYGVCMGNCDVMGQMAGVLDKLGDTIAAVYAGRTKKTPAEWRHMMKAETWMTAQETVDMGLADGIAGDEPVAKAQFDLSIYNHPPAGLTGEPAKGEPTKRDIERALRDAGLTRAAAKSLLAGYSGIDEDDEARDVAEAELEKLLDGLKILNF